MIDDTLLQLGTVAILFLVSIREFFAYLKSRKNGNGNGSGDHGAHIFQELQKMNSNHLSHIQGAIEEGNRNLVKTIHDDNMLIIQLLGEIRGGQK